MKRLLYPMIASALITIVPFLLTFEKGQDIVRGLFGYEYFALLLLITFIKSKQARISFANKKKIPVYTGMTIVLILSIFALFTTAWLDLQNLLAIKNWDTDWYGIIPFITCGLAVAIVWQTKPFKFNTICFILFIALILHLEAYNYYAEQPLAQFPTMDYLKRIAPKPIQRKNIADNYKSQYIVTDSVTITRDYLDSSRNNVIVLVESWGIPLDINRFKKELSVFKGIDNVIVGIHDRMYSRTRTAEREDLIKEISRDSITRQKDTLFLPKVFNDLGYQTTFLFGGDSLEYCRFKYINNIGFNQAIYRNGLNDSSMMSKIDIILADKSQKHFIAWTTTDTKFPILDFSNIYYSNANAIDSAYSYKLSGTLTLIAEHARTHPETRFIIQGDHNPILSPTKFQDFFYKRWVPFVVLN